MYYLCLECFEIYSDEIADLTIHDIRVRNCPKYDCEGDVVEIDELLIDTIIELNKKGYYTKYCCSGHQYQSCPNCYIYFEVLPDILPKGYTLDKPTEYSKTIIRRYFDGSNTKIFNDILKNAKELRRWAKNLPDIT